MDVPVAQVNAAQLAAWDGDQGGFWRDRADRFDDGVARFQAHLVEAAAVRQESVVLDVGCGSGLLSRGLGRGAGGGSVLGVDLSSPLLELARERTLQERLSNVRFVHADAQNYPFPAKCYDLVVSRHGVMFFGDVSAAFANFRRALRPGGRVVLLTWQAADRNDWIMAFRAALDPGQAPPQAAGAGPFSLSDPEQVRSVLDAAGFVDVTLTDVREPMWFGHDTDDAFAFLAGQFAAALAGMPAAERARAEESLRTSLRSHERRGGVQYDSAAWLIQARRP